MACQVPGRPKGGACRLSQAALAIFTAGSECARGPMVKLPRPQEQVRQDVRDRARHQLRSESKGRCGAGCAKTLGRINDVAAARRRPPQGRPILDMIPDVWYLYRC